MMTPAVTAALVALRDSLETLEPSDERTECLRKLRHFDELLNPPEHTNIKAVDISKCVLCRADHLQQQVRSYIEDGLPHPTYSHWYECPIAKAPVGLYIEGAEASEIDEFVRDKLDTAMRRGRWLVLISHAKSDGSVQHDQKNSEYPRDRMLSRKLAAFAAENLCDGPEASNYALDWLVAEMTRQISPPPSVKLQTAVVPAGPALLTIKESTT